MRQFLLILVFIVGCDSLTEKKLVPMPDGCKESLRWYDQAAEDAKDNPSLKDYAQQNKTEEERKIKLLLESGKSTYDLEAECEVRRKAAQKRFDTSGW